MKKITSILTILTTVILIIFNSTACAVPSDKKNNFLNINDSDKGEYNKNIENLAFNFMYNLPKNLQPKLDRDYFQPWNWKESDDLKTLYGRVIGNVFTPEKTTSHEYWEIIIKKTLDKGIFVNWYKENDYNPWNKKLNMKEQ